VKPLVSEGEVEFSAIRAQDDGSAG